MKKELITRKQHILRILRSKKTKLTCQQICAKITISEGLTGNVAHYLSGSISSILAKLVKAKILMYAAEKGPKGGHVYKKA